ncbi:hypothetical protein HPB50_004738 [Hyalomma asiaticum]|uniref:Uncharacterized protein n=1 Tax=Hyalomma asiaticum TaxID=266040 RepID=A0ACB7S4L8_HYAAI|nr:hypothetical protein HPB50_004738 [Hyalomma asiaticum]
MKEGAGALLLQRREEPKEEPGANDGVDWKGFLIGDANFKERLVWLIVISAECHEGLMRIELRFNGSFLGLVYSTGYAHDPDCVYVNGSGAPTYTFDVRANRCGTLGRSDLLVRGHQLWNSLTVQYDRQIEDSADERFRVTCEYAFDYWKTVSFPLLNVE